MRITFGELKDIIKNNSNIFYKSIPEDGLVYLKKEKGYEYMLIKDKYNDYIIRINYLEEDKLLSKRIKRDYTSEGLFDYEY